MAEVVTFEGYLPPARYDAKPWTQVRVEEAATMGGTYAVLETIALAPVDTDPANPSPRSFTTEHGTALNYWYRVVFVDATGDVSQPSTPVQNTAASSSVIYTTVAELKNALSLTGQTYADQDLADSVEAASRAVDGICDTQFYLSAETRKYSPVSEEYVLIDDAATVATVASGWGTLSGYTTLVVDRDYAKIGAPVTTVLRALNGFRFPRGVVNGVTVTGDFGWSAPPADVKRATLILASRIFKRSREAPFGVVAFELDGASVRVPGRDPDVVTLLKPYTRSGMIE